MSKSEVQQKPFMPYMYILKCTDDSYYTGSTWSLKQRLAQHQRGEGARHTARRLPVELVYFEEFARVEEAFRREKQVQGWSRRKKEALMVGDVDELKRLAACRNGFGSLRQGSGQAAQPAGASDVQSEVNRSLSGAEGNDVEEVLE